MEMIDIEAELLECLKCQDDPDCKRKKRLEARLKYLQTEKSWRDLTDEINGSR